MTTRSVVEELLNRMAGEPDVTAELFAEQIDWMVAGSEAVPWLSDCSTRADVAEFFRTMLAHFVPEQRRASPGHFLVDGEHAVVTGHITQVLKATGRSFTMPFALHVTVVDELITRYHVYEDSFTVAEAYLAQG